MDAPAARARAGSLALVRAVPMWAWLTVAVVVSAGIRFWLARKIVAPWIFVDELIYSELAKSIAAHGSFLIRGVPSHGFGFVYPVLIAPAFRIASVPQAYAAAKAIDTVLMSLAAIPAYLLARRLMRPGLALLAAALEVAAGGDVVDDAVLLRIAAAAAEVGIDDVAALARAAREAGVVS